jgi:hypothetical protein
MAKTNKKADKRKDITFAYPPDAPVIVLGSDRLRVVTAKTITDVTFDGKIWNFNKEQHRQAA